MADVMAPDMMAIVSKAVFDKDSPAAKLGAVLPMKVYRSASKHLARLQSGSRLFLVTVRPPAEALWLVAVLAELKFDGEKWQAARNRYPLTDISALKSQLKFESGKGLVAAKGALGMSLQTPRVLSPEDAALLLRAAGPLPPPRVRAPGPINLVAHDATSPLPCLCSKCLPDAAETVEVAGANYLRAQAEAHGRVLRFWVPTELKAQLPAVTQAVLARMQANLKPLKQPAGDKQSSS